jgi:hypothetical protein
LILWGEREAKANAAYSGAKKEAAPDKRSLFEKAMF